VNPRKRARGIFVGIVIACASASAVSLAQPAADAPVDSSDAGVPSATDAAPATTLEAAAETMPDAAAPATVAAPPEREPSEVGFNFGVRAGYSFPFGGAKSIGLHDIVGGAVSFAIDLGYFIDRHIYIGGYFLYGIGTNVAASGITCPLAGSDDTCSANVIRLGIVGRYHFRPAESLDPWAGIGFGYDIVNSTESDSDGSTVTQAPNYGFELLNLQTGVDFKPRPFYGIGPYMELSIGHYNNPNGSATQIHEWLTFGLRLRTGV
jgi:hypothetical protein